MHTLWKNIQIFWEGAVLSYRAFSFWLPTVPGAIAYISLLRQEPATASAEGARA